jgi:hypothetical protein
MVDRGEPESPGMGNVPDWAMREGAIEALGGVVCGALIFVSAGLLFAALAAALVRVANLWKAKRIKL